MPKLIGTLELTAEQRAHLQDDLRPDKVHAGSGLLEKKGHLALTTRFLPRPGFRRRIARPLRPTLDGSWSTADTTRASTRRTRRRSVPPSDDTTV